MSKPSSKNQPTAQQRKQLLKNELKRLENRMGTDVDGICGEVSQLVDPRKFITKHPVGSLSISLLMGFLLSKGRKKKQNITYVSPEHSYTPVKPPRKLGIGTNNGITSMILGELKKHLARKGTAWAMEFLEEKLHQLQKQQAASDQKEEEEQKG